MTETLEKMIFVQFHPMLSNTSPATHAAILTSIEILKSKQNSTFMCRKAYF